MASAVPNFRALGEIAERAEEAAAAAGALDDDAFSALYEEARIVVGAEEWALEAMLLHAPISWLEKHVFAPEP